MKKGPIVAAVVGLALWATVFWGIVVVAVLSAVEESNAKEVTVVNDYPVFARIAGSCADDPLDLDPGESGTILVRQGHTSACGVYLGGAYTYSGCIEFSSGPSQAPTVEASRAASATVEEDACTAHQS